MKPVTIIGGIAVAAVLATAAAGFNPAPAPPPPIPAVSTLSPEAAKQCAMLKADIASEKDYFGQQKARFVEMAAHYSPQNRIDLDQAERDFHSMNLFVDRVADDRELWRRARGWCVPTVVADAMVAGTDEILTGLRANRETMRQLLTEWQQKAFTAWAAQSARQ